MSVNNWYIFDYEIRGTYKAYPHITDISGKSNSQWFQNWRYISILIINGISHREELLRDWVLRNNSCTSVQWNLRKRSLLDPPPQASMRRWFGNFENQGCVCKKKSDGPPCVVEEAVWQMETIFSQSARKSVQKGSRRNRLCGRFYADGGCEPYAAAALYSPETWFFCCWYSFLLEVE
jgi:hypothetical protein